MKQLKHASDLACRFCSDCFLLRCFYQIIQGFGDFSISQTVYARSASSPSVKVYSASPT